MRRAWTLLVVGLAAGCSSTDAPKQAPALAACETASMPLMEFDEVVARVKKPARKALLIVLWRAETEAKAPCLAAATELAGRHTEAGLEVLALNVDMPEDVRDKALPLVGKLGSTKLEARAYQDDVMGLGAMLDYTWGGQTPAAFLYDRRGKQVYKGRGKDAVAEAAARVPAALASR